MWSIYTRNASKTFFSEAKIVFDLLEKMEFSTIQTNIFLPAMPAILQKGSLVVHIVLLSFICLYSIPSQFL